jgi:hypothetical protein
MINGCIRSSLTELKGNLIIHRRIGELLFRFGESPMRFRHSAGFGKRIEFWIIGRMLKEGLDVYVPLVDDNAIDAVIRRPDGSFVEVQIKARSRDAKPGDGALFAAIPHELRNNYWFVFYSERLDLMWIMTSEEFIAEAVQNKNGKNVGLRSIWFNGKRKNKETGIYDEHVYPRFHKYLATDFRRIFGRPSNRTLGPEPE